MSYDNLSRADGHGETSIPPYNFVAGGINATTVPAEGNSSKRPIVFNNCQVTNNKKRKAERRGKISLKTGLFRKYPSQT
jgi:hypothetical protein